jgi:hypothetical protein
MPSEEIQTLLNEAGKTRITIKTERMKKLIQENGIEQAFYEELMAALGFKNNSTQMRKLAKLLHLNMLKEESENDPNKAYALLLGVSGLLPAQPKSSFDKESKIMVRNIWDWWWKKSGMWLDNIMHKQDWMLSGIRPQNHPQRRLLAIANLFITKEKSLLETMQTLFASHNADKNAIIKEALKTLAINSPTYWHTHILLGSPYQKDAGSLIGKGRASAILINIVIPFLAAMDFTHLLHCNFLADLPTEDDNTIVRRSARNLFGKDHNPRSLYNCALRQQGLIQIYYDFCINDKTMCSGCPLATALASE